MVTFVLGCHNTMVTALGSVCEVALLSLAGLSSTLVAKSKGKSDDK